MANQSNQTEDIFTPEEHLNLKYLNPNYRGSWVVQMLTNHADYFNNSICYLLAVFNRAFHVSGMGCSKVTLIEINQFNHYDIPEGEWCWFGNEAGDWFQGRFSRVDECGRYNSLESLRIKMKYCVPTLIAEDKKTAIMLKDWDK